MSDTITVRGFAGTEPEHRTPPSGNEVTTLRLGSTPRWRNSHTGEWASGSTNWYTVAAFGRLAANVAESISKGDPVVVVGRPKVRQWENDDGVKGTDVEINAMSLGHDLSYGRTEFTKATSAASRTEEQQEPAQQGQSQEPQSSPQQTGGSESSEAPSGQEPRSEPPAAEQPVPWNGEPQLQRAS